MAKAAPKRSAPQSKAPSKKRKLAAPTRPAHQNKAPKATGKGKEKAKNRDTIPIPTLDINDDDAELSDEDLEMFDELGGAAAFLGHLDQKGIARSKKETERLHRLTKPVRQTRSEDDDLPSLHSHSEDEDNWSSGISATGPLSSDEEDEEATDLEADFSDSDAEMPYETLPRKRRPSWETQADTGIQRLPIKLADGRIEKRGTKSVPLPVPTEESSGSDTDTVEIAKPAVPQREDVATGARFGRPAVVDVVSTRSRKARIQAAKEQIAGICQEIVADPENSLGLLRRLHTFSLPEIATPSHPDPVQNDEVIRRLAILSQLAVFKDVIPGYRIRALSEKEKEEKVSQMVARTRDWEQGLVGVYQTYLRSLDRELKAKSPLADTALQCMCTLLVEATHFNFRTNLISSIVARLSKRSWDQSSDLCMDTLIKVFRADLTGQPSLEVVRLLNRMIKERKFNVHPEVLSCLLHLRLKSELSVRASETKADKNQNPNKTISKGRAAARRAKGKPTEQPHLSKKARKALKETKEIEKEMHEAEAEVDKEERATTQTETLKLLFVLYFRILKSQTPTPLLSAALRGISRYAHQVNIDFFKDLMNVLKDLVARTPEDDDDDDGVNAETTASTHAPHAEDVRCRLECIVTAFELLTGQGEALSLDLSDLIASLYALILPLGLSTDIEASPARAAAPGGRSSHAPSTADLLFRALDLAFAPRALGASAPSTRSAAFAKRTLTAALAWPPATVLRAIDFVSGLLSKDSRLEALLAADDDRAANGVYRPEIDDPQLSNALGAATLWELSVLQEHSDAHVREAARRLSHFTRE